MAKHTWSGSDDDWVRSRYQAAYDVLRARGQSDDAAKPIAISIVSHWAIETGRGKNEYNYNVCNITAVGAQPYVELRDISGVTMRFRAFMSLAEGVGAYLDLLSQSRYANAKEMLFSNPTSSDWYIALGHAGWFDPTAAQPPSTWDAARTLYESVRKSVAQVIG